jgi:hypothetical protein
LMPIADGDILLALQATETSTRRGRIDLDAAACKSQGVDFTRTVSPHR